jgi:hypothetical protein
VVHIPSKRGCQLLQMHNFTNMQLVEETRSKFTRFGFRKNSVSKKSQESNINWEKVNVFARVLYDHDSLWLVWERRNENAKQKTENEQNGVFL